MGDMSTAAALKGAEGWGLQDPRQLGFRRVEPLGMSPCDKARVGRCWRRSSVSG
jgi:hypothetical protein